MCVLYIMLCVGDFDCLIKFYIEVFGMQVLCCNDYLDGKFIFVFVGYGSEDDGVVIELIYNWGVDMYEFGIVYGYIVLVVLDVYKVCEEIRQCGGKVVCEVGLMKYGSIVIVFVEDFDGYKVELIQKQ